MCRKTKMMGVQLRWTAALLAMASCPSTLMCQSSVPDGWRKVDAGGGFTIALPTYMKQTDVVGIENFVAEYTDGRMRLLIEYKPWSWFVERKGRPRSYMRGYRERETRIDGRRAYVRTYYVAARKGRLSLVNLTVVDRADGLVLLQISLTSTDASDLPIARRIFDTIDLP
jgi:hypothetical protein